jgi:hypothetical protein
MATESDCSMSRLGSFGPMTTREWRLVRESRARRTVLVPF